MVPRNAMLAQMLGAITSRSAEQIATFDTDAAPLPPSGNGVINPGDLAMQAALAEAKQMEALENIGAVLADLQSQITVLSATVDEQGEQLARVTAALKAFDCQIDVLNPFYKDKIASVAVCLDQGICTCDVGQALGMPGSGYSDEQARGNDSNS